MKDVTKADHLRNAVLTLETVIAKLKIVKQDLLNGRSDQYMPVAIKLAELEQIHDILTDPECTPELYAVGGSE